MTKHYQERRHCWAIEKDDALVGYLATSAATKTVLYATKSDAQKVARWGGGRPVKVRVKYEVIES